MAMSRAFLLAFAASAAAVAASGEVLAAGRQAPASSVFTAQQATAGKAGYAKSCASCHMPDMSGNGEIPALAGTAFKETWGGRSTKDFFDYMSAAMPYGGPSLSVDAYTEIAAYILQFNGAVAGERGLGAATVARIGDLTAAHVPSPPVPAPPGRAEAATGAAPAGGGSDGGALAP